VAIKTFRTTALHSPKDRRGQNLGSRSIAANGEILPKWRNISHLPIVSPYLYRLP